MKKLQVCKSIKDFRVFLNYWQAYEAHLQHKTASLWDGRNISSGKTITAANIIFTILLPFMQAAFYLC